MSHQRQRPNNGMVRPQGRWGHPQNQQCRFHPPPVAFLHGEIQRLGSLLEDARARWSAEHQKVACLEAELEDTKLQLKRQKSLKDMYINMGKEMKRELMRVEKFSDSATLEPAAIASIVYNDMKYKRKKMLQNDFVELKTAYILEQEAFKAQIQAEKEKSNALKEELDKIKTSYEELRSKCEATVAVVQQQDQQLLEKDDLYLKMSLEMTLLQEREKHFQSQLDRAEVSYRELKNREKQELELLNDLRAEKDDLYQKMSLEIALLQEREKWSQSQLDQAEVSCHELKIRAKQDLELINDLRAEKDDLYQKMSSEIALLQERKEQSESQLDQAEVSYQELKNRENQDLQLINNLRAEKDELYQKMSLEIALLQEREKQSQSQLDQAEVSYQELNSKYEKEVSALKQQAATYQKEVDHEKKANLEREKKDLMLLDNMRAEKDYLQENVSKEITFLQEKEKHLQSNMDKIKLLYQELNSRYETEVSALKQQAETFKMEIKTKKAHLETENKNMELLNNLRAEKDDLRQKFTTELQKTGVNTELCGELKEEKDLSNPETKIVECEEPSLQNESIPEINLSEPASMDLEQVPDKTLSEISEPSEISEGTEVTPVDNKTVEELLNIHDLDPETMEDAAKGTKSNPLILENTPALSGCEDTKKVEEEQEHL